MMKLKLIRFLLGIFISLLLFGCVDLDLAPTDKFSDETYWTSEEKASSLLNMAYRQMNSSGNAFRDERLSDNLYNGYGGDDIKNIVNGQANASTGIFNSTWGQLYGGIKTVHTFLTNVDRVEMDEDVKERMKYEARFIRAYLYFQLTNWWGDVPFFTQDINIEEAKTIERTSQSVVIEWLHSELEDIADGLPTKEEYSIDDRGRVTSGAAIALNARVALNYNDWDKVKRYTEMLIGNTEYGSYALHPNYEQIFYKEFEYNDEIILDIQYVP
ncbi:MAG: RagB/SusD family nutrient uptake outer membrane protein, partial [Bacteroidales bacterium]|nr:RagB/SusD family nutrient uptake outer membrane protein [Bacteroidales bacterium]